MDHLRAEERQNVQILKAHNEDYVMYTSFEISMWQPIEVLLGAPRPASCQLEADPSLVLALPNKRCTHDKEICHVLLRHAGFDQLQQSVPGYKQGSTQSACFLLLAWIVVRHNHPTVSGRDHPWRFMTKNDVREFVGQGIVPTHRSMPAIQDYQAFIAITNRQRRPAILLSNRQAIEVRLTETKDIARSPNLDFQVPRQNQRGQWTERIKGEFSAKTLGGVFAPGLEATL